MTTIAIDGSVLAAGPITGIPRYTRELVRALGRLGAPERFLLVARGRLEAADYPGIEVVSRDLPLWRTLYLPLTLLGRRCRLVHFPDPYPPAWLPCPSVVTVHDLSFLRHPEWFTPEMARVLAGTWVPAIRGARHLVCVSDFTRREVAELLGIPGERMTVTPLGASAWPEAPSAHPHGGIPYVLSVGTIQPRKNFARLVGAFARAGAALADFHLCIAGATGWKAEDLGALAEQEGVRDRVRLLGAISDRELASWYRHAAAFALPSLYEGFGLPLLEAMAEGLPCLTSKCSSLPEVAGEAALLVDPTNGEEIAQGLVRICLDQGLRERLSAAARARSATFTWEACAQRTLAAYRQARGGSPTSA